MQSAMGLLAEYGLILPKGVNLLRRSLPELLEDGENGLSDLFRRLLAQSYQQLQELDGHIDDYTQEMKCQSQQNESIRAPLVMEATHQARQTAIRFLVQEVFWTRRSGRLYRLILFVNLPGCTEADTING